MRRRVLSRASGAAYGAIAVIAVGIGLAAMVFALSDAFVWKQLPYANPDQLVSIHFDLGNPHISVTQADFPSLASWQSRTDLFEGIAGFENRGWMRVQVSDRVLPLRAVAATDNLFEVLGVHAEWTDTGAAWVSSRAVSLSVGRLEPGRSARILPEGLLRVGGVLPAAFLLPEPGRTDSVDAIVPLSVGPVKVLEGEQPHLVARLRPGVTPQSVEAALNAVMKATGYSPSVVPLNVSVKTGYPKTYGNAATAARVSNLATGAVSASVLVVLVCWMNIFNIAMTRGLYRQAELATRTALGASSSRIVGHLAAEAGTVAGIGSATALFFAWLVLAATVAVLPPAFATLGLPSMTLRVALFTVLSGAIAGVAWCLASILAWRFTRRRHVHQVTSRDGGAIRVVRFTLVAGQFGVAAVFLTAATLLARSYLNLVNVDTGMEEQTQTLTVAHDSALPLTLRRDVVNRVIVLLRRAEGVQAVGASAGILFRPGAAQVTSPRAQFFTERVLIAGDYFRALGMKFVAGRPPGPGDRAAAVVTEAFARQYSDGRLPVDVNFTGGWKTLAVTGMIRDVRTKGSAFASRPAIFEVSDDWQSLDATTTYLVRVSGRSSSAAWERLIQEVDPQAIVLEGGTLGERLGRAILERTFASVVVGIFAAAGIVIIALGLAGVVAYTVVKRTREIAIRLALGATPSAVTRLVVRDAAIAAICGVAGGVIVSVWLSSALQILLYEVSPTDTATLAFTALSLVGVVLIAALVPAMRVRRIPPARALRVE
jgi:predicted permease